ncbi:hypothetical protein GCM10022286_00340 [Gryllotalpicola daejeonensis]|uniref:Uncharacterized protein n=1 Tax=Gryllotalpicola daejeonensis TaxID=993087 RepID=A0ABP7ZCL9_9MICO
MRKNHSIINIAELTENLSTIHATLGLITTDSGGLTWTAFIDRGRRIERQVVDLDDDGEGRIFVSALRADDEESLPFYVEVEPHADVEPAELVARHVRAALFGSVHELWREDDDLENPWRDPQLPDASEMAAESLAAYLAIPTWAEWSGSQRAKENGRDVLVHRVWDRDNPQCSAEAHVADDATPKALAKALRQAVQRVERLRADGDITPELILVQPTLA